jgi:hypothetical protein
MVEDKSNGRITHATIIFYNCLGFVDHLRVSWHPHKERIIIPALQVRN